MKRWFVVWPVKAHSLCWIRLQKITATVSTSSAGPAPSKARRALICRHTCRSTFCPTPSTVQSYAFAAHWRPHATNFPIDRLIFETLEIEHVDNYRHLTNILREYREFGFKTAIDDFGAGYSGLNLLADFQPDLIKLDMALIRDVDQDRVRQVIVRGIVTMCAELDVTVIAEGIESAGERDFLADCGIFLMQGYWFARPAFKALAQVPDEAWKR